MLEMCAQHMTELRAALALRGLSKYNITTTEDREAAHLASVERMNDQTVIDPIRTSQAMILQKAIHTRPDLVFNKQMFCPCCAAREDFFKVKAAAPETFGPDDLPWDQQLLVDAAQAIDNDLIARGIKS